MKAYVWFKSFLMQYHYSPIIQFPYPSLVIIDCFNTIFNSFFLTKKSYCLYCFLFNLWWWHILINLAEFVLHKVWNLYFLIFVTLILIIVSCNLKLLKAIRIVKESGLILPYLLLKRYSYIFIICLELCNNRHLSHILFDMSWRNLHCSCFEIILRRIILDIISFSSRNNTISTVSLNWCITHVHIRVRIFLNYRPNKIHFCSYGLISNKPINSKLPINLSLHTIILIQALL